MRVIERAATHASLSAGGVFASEWLKLWSLRSTRWASLVGVLGMALIAVYGASNALPAQPGHDEASLTIALLVITGGVGPAMIVAGIVAVAAGGSEFGSGAALTTFAVAPRRELVVLAKLVVASAFGVIVGTVGMIATALGAAPILELRGYDNVFLDARTLMPAATAPLAIGAAAAVSAAIGVIVRSTAAGTACVLVVQAILPLALLGAAMALGDPVPLNVSSLLPSVMGAHALYDWPGFEVPDDVFGPWDSWVMAPWQAGTVLLAWVVASALAAVVVVRRRDV